MSLVHQTVWGWPIYSYLFLGGLGGACFALAALIDLYLKQDRRLILAAGLSGFIFLTIGTAFLLYDLLQPLKAIFAFLHPTSWIFWGIIFILAYFVFGLLYLLIYVPLPANPPGLPDEERRTKLERGMARLLRLPWELQRWLKGRRRPLGLLVIIFGFAIAIYTGLLVSAAPGIPFWHTPVLPLLFLVSAFSTGAAYLIPFTQLWREEHLEGWLERLDVVLILFELIILGLYINYTVYGPVGGRASINYLLGNLGFVLGFLIFGLFVPLLLEFYSLLRGHRMRRLFRYTLPLLSSLLVLFGGFLLRLYVLYAGIYEFPW